MFRFPKEFEFETRVAKKEESKETKRRERKIEN